MALEHGCSLSKENYCFKALYDEDLSKMQNFQRDPIKLNYVYVFFNFQRHGHKK